MKQCDRNLEEMKKDEVLFEKNDEDPTTVATASATLTQATTHNIMVLNGKLSETKLENIKLKDDIINLQE